jgi:hypothetical protein
MVGGGFTAKKSDWKLIEPVLPRRRMYSGTTATLYCLCDGRSHSPNHPRCLAALN